MILLAHARKHVPGERCRKPTKPTKSMGHNEQTWRRRDWGGQAGTVKLCVGSICLHPEPRPLKSGTHECKELLVLAIAKPRPFEVPC